MTTSLFFVRHGETDWNHRGKIQGHTDIPLNETGRQQALKLQEALSCVHFDAVYSSDLTRASETAEVIINNRYRVMKEAALRELFYGEWEGCTRDQLLSRNEPIDEYFLDPITYPPTKGESVVSLHERIGSFLEKVIGSHQGKEILCVSHAGAIRAALSMLLTKGPEIFGKLIIENCSISKISIEKSGRIRLSYLNK